jgi:hypothetical protein
MDFMDVPSNRMHQMSLAQANAAIKEQRIEGHITGLCHTSSRGMGQLIGLSHNKIIKSINISPKLNQLKNIK